MFTIDMKEKDSDCVELYDIDEDTLHSLLQFIYTDSVADLKWDALLKLYAAADKYQIELLKLKCTSLLKASLRTCNACSMLIFADMHSDKDLKIFVQNFILRKHKEIFESEDWKTLMEDQSILAMETMYLKCINE
ncbi:TD and POZ domain-containing protein 4 [Argiope bruennichi]|uniref:TD and POZ domain-containing protein 4 n=1 Tax=Argiope bruennichi TaxID=94029 RepID=A0A8T0EDE2_ARGBR|nr:TD and POZ domain-containing protein 4 [Argiope bruennichi]